MKKYLALFMLLIFAAGIAIAGTTNLDTLVVDQLKVVGTTEAQTITLSGVVPLQFRKADMTTTESDAKIAVLGDTGSYVYALPYAGCVTGLALTNNALITAGTITAEVYVNGVGTDFVVTMSSTTEYDATVTQSYGTDSFAASSTLEVYLTGSSIAPSGSIDSIISVFVTQ